MNKLYIATLILITLLLSSSTQLCAINSDVQVPNVSNINLAEWPYLGKVVAYWTFTYDSDPIDGYFFISVWDGSILCAGIDKSTQCDCECEWEADNGWCGCYFDSYEPFQYRDEVFTCMYVLWWMDSEYQNHVLGAYAGKCSYSTFLPAIMNNG